MLSLRALLGPLVAASIVLAAPAAAMAQRNPPAPVRFQDRVYIVRPGDSLQRIASRLQIAPRDLAAVNHLAPPFNLAVGRRLRLTEEVPQEVLRTLPTREEVSSAGDGTAHRTGIVTLVRARDNEEMVANFNANTPALRTRVERWMQARNGHTHIVHPRLQGLLPILSDRFGGRRIVIVSGFRPHRGGRDEPRNRHAMGYAVDLRVEGATLRQVHDYCRTLPNVGCGLSTRGNFVHIDVRTEASAWTINPRTGDPNTPPEDDLAEVLADAAPPEAR